MAETIFARTVGKNGKNGGKMAKTPQFNKFIFDFVMFILDAASFLA